MGFGDAGGGASTDPKTVNRQIAETISKNPTKFLERNNGITFKATNVVPVDADTLKLGGGSIVNGCQTTMSLVHARTPLDDCYVLVKVVQSEKAWGIAKSANHQNSIKQIEIELAQYIRPQVIRLISVQSGINFTGQVDVSAVELVGRFSKTQVRYDEIKHLFIGLFSRTPANISKVDYNMLRPDDVIACLMEQD